MTFFFLSLNFIFYIDFFRLWNIIISIMITAIEFYRIFNINDYILCENCFYLNFYQDGNRFFFTQLIITSIIRRLIYHYVDVNEITPDDLINLEFFFKVILMLSIFWKWLWRFLIIIWTTCCWKKRNGTVNMNN